MKKIKDKKNKKPLMPIESILRSIIFDSFMFALVSIYKKLKSEKENLNKNLNKIVFYSILVGFSANLILFNVIYRLYLVSFFSGLCLGFSIEMLSRTIKEVKK